MGVGDFLKRLFSDRPVQVDYSGVEDERLFTLWKERSSLTPEAVARLQAEASRRGLDLASREPAKRRGAAAVPFEVPTGAPPEPPARVLRTNPLHVVAPCGVVLRTGENQGVLCLLPLRDAGTEWTRDFSPGMEIEALVICNDGEGLLPSAWMAERLGLKPESVFVLSPERPADRPLPGATARDLLATPLPRKLERGPLFLTASREHPNLLIASWTTPPGAPRWRALVGPSVPMEEVAAQGATHVVGGLAIPEQAQVPMLEVLTRLSHVVMMLDVQGVVDWGATLAQLGVDVTTVTRVRQDALAQLGTALGAGRWEEVPALLTKLSDKELETVTTGLLIQQGREQDARRLLELACEQQPDSGARRFQQGVVAYVLGDMSQARACYEQATRASKPEPRAWANLAAVHRRSGDAAEALRCAEAAQEAMPGDPVSIAHRLGSLLELGRQEEARALLAGSRMHLGEAERASWAAWVEEGRPPESTHDLFPHLAVAARDCAKVFLGQGRREEASALLRRSLHWDGSRSDVRLDLGALLSDLGRDEEAVAVYSEGVARTRSAGEVAALRYNRALCRLRQRSLATARDDLRACLELLPGWAEPKAQLAVVLAEEGARAEASSLLQELAAAHASPELISRVRERLAR